MNIEKLFEALVDALPQMGYSAPNCEAKLASFARIKKFISACGEQTNIGVLLDDYEADIRKKFMEGRLSPYAYQSDFKSLLLIREYIQTGSISYPIIQYGRYRQPNEYYRQIITDYETFHSKTHTPASTSCARASIRDFLFFIEDRDVRNISELSHADVTEYILFLSDKYNSSIATPLTRIRVFFRFLIARGMIEAELIDCLNVRSAKRTKLRGFFKKDEMDKIISASVDESMQGKRNYAMLLLAKQTGLRGIDIRNLKRENIDWEQKGINIIQSKTRKPLSLPLENSVGNAIADYLLNWRPKSDCPNVFLTVTVPFRPLSKGALTSIVKRSAAKSGLYWDPEDYKGIYSFRHSMGTHLLASGASTDMIAEVLGHSSPSAVKPYLSIDVENLKMCAMPIAAYDCEPTNAEVGL